MEIEMMPTIGIDDLVDALNIQYGWELDRHNLSELMFPEPYSNDCYKSYWFDDFLEGNEYQQENCVIAYLQDILPGHTKVLIDITW